MSQLKYFNGTSWVPVVVGSQGIQGEKGDQGNPGTGVPTGGTTGQILVRYTTAPAGSVWSSDYSRSQIWYSASTATPLTTSSSAQSLFGISTGAALEANSTYYLDMSFCTTSAASGTHAVNLSFPYSGSLTAVGGINYNVQQSQNTTGLASPTITASYSTIVATTAETAVTTSSQSATTYYRTFTVRGIIRTQSAGNLLPKITWTSGSASAPSLGANSYVRLMKLGADSSVSNPTGW